jgi:signal transduction histidine kinase
LEGEGLSLTLLQWAETCLANSPAPVSIIQREGYRLLYANPVFRKLHSVPAIERELPISSVLDPSGTRELEALVDIGISSGAMAHEGVVTPHRGEGPLHCSVWPLADTDGGQLAIVMLEARQETDSEARRALQVDVTQRLLLSALRDQNVADAAQAAEEVAVRANAATARFLATMSHELRTPLHAIGGYVELLSMGLRGPVTPAQREDLLRIQHAQEHLTGLINSVLTFSKIESGSFSLETRPVDLWSTVNGVLEMLMPHFRRRSLVYQDLTDDRPGNDPVVVIADPEKLRQILINLFTNAVKFTDVGGMVSAGFEIRGSMIATHISDTGCGIADDQIPKVFEPFVQIDRTLAATDQGVGLGLSISRDLARAMGGDITAVSAVGMGSTFTLTLPRASTDAPPSP